MIVWLVIILAILAVIYFHPSRESMTNKDLLDTLKTFGEKGTKPKSKDVNEEPIYGPKSGGLAEPEPTPGGKGDHSESNPYPDIYGPEITPIPGSKVCKKGKNESDCADNEVYQFNPDFDKAFPRAEGEPRPFLTDFSKFQH